MSFQKKSPSSSFSAMKKKQKIAAQSPQRLLLVACGPYFDSAQYRPARLLAPTSYPMGHAMSATATSYNCMASS